MAGPGGNGSSDSGRAGRDAGGGDPPPGERAPAGLVLACRRPRPRPGDEGSAPDAAAAPPDTIVYTSEDAGVIAPRIDRSRLPANPPLGVSQDEIPQVEVVISATGEVESVKLITQPARVNAAMMLSAVKNWRFLPALREGQPVRYRMRLRLTNQ